MHDDHVPWTMMCDQSNSLPFIHGERRGREREETERMIYVQQ